MPAQTHIGAHLHVNTYTHLRVNTYTLRTFVKYIWSYIAIDFIIYFTNQAAMNS